MKYGIEITKSGEVELVTKSSAEYVKNHSVATAHGYEGVDMVRAKIGRRWSYYVARYHRPRVGGDKRHMCWNGPYTKGEADSAYAGLVKIANTDCDCAECAA
jgi:hypothetical protein